MAFASQFHNSEQLYNASPGSSTFSAKKSGLVLAAEDLPVHAAAADAVARRHVALHVAAADAVAGLHAAANVAAVDAVAGLDAAAHAAAADRVAGLHIALHVAALDAVAGLHVARHGAFAAHGKFALDVEGRAAAVQLDAFARARPGEGRVAYEFVT